MPDLPPTPDFDIWPVTHTVQGMLFSEDGIEILWSDGCKNQLHALLLREDSPDPVTT